MSQVIDKLAQVLSTENLDVVHAEVRSASFDLVNRTLTLPMWKGLSESVETMLMCHEVGHALFTPQRYVDLIKENRQLSVILNIVEDARIERLFKERYPGSVKDFVTAAKELREQDFFELQNTGINNMKFLDRANVFFKLGSAAGATFSKAEAEFVARMGRTSLFSEVEQLTKDIFEFLTKEQELVNEKIEQETDGEPQEDEPGDDEYNDEYDDSDGDDLDDRENDESNAGESDANQDDSNPQLGSSTMEILQNKLASAATGRAPVYYDLADSKIPYITYKEVMKLVKEKMVSNLFEENTEEIRKMVIDKKANFRRQVNHLKTQFDMKKAAVVHSKITKKKTGQIDPKTIAQYKTKDDIFRRTYTAPVGQNHGVVFILDWSSSMTDGKTLIDSINHIIQMVIFCRESGIPHRVLAFTEYSKIEIFELFNDRMSLSEYNTMLGYILSNWVSRAIYHGSTPLAYTIEFLVTFLPKFKEEYKLDKLTTIFYTDGGNTKENINLYARGQLYLKDPKTKKHYSIDSNSRDSIVASAITVRLRILKDRTGTSIMTFFAVPWVNFRTHKDAIFNSGIYNNYHLLATETYGEFKQNGFISLNSPGRDRAFLIKTTTETSSLQSNINPNMTSTQAAKALIKNSSSTRRDFLVLEQIMDVLA